jgi:hypothetical protein
MTHIILYINKLFSEDFMKISKSKFLFAVLMTAALSFMVSCGDSDGTSSNSNNSNNSGNSNNGSTPKTQADSEAKLKELAVKGYELKFTTTTITDDETEVITITVGEKGNTVWFVTDEAEYIEVKESDDTSIFYVKTGDEYIKTGTDFTNNMEMMVEGLYWAYDWDGFGFTKSGTKTVAGKTCDYYTLTDKTYGDYEFAVERETGLTFYFKTSSDGDSVNFEVKSFKIGDEVTVPIPSVEEDFE